MMIYFTLGISIGIVCYLLGFLRGYSITAPKPAPVPLRSCYGPWGHP